MTLGLTSRAAASLLMVVGSFWVAAQSAGAVSVAEQLAGRPALVHVPAKLPVGRERKLVIVLHGGLGNADLIAVRRTESRLNLDAAADQSGFIVAYLNGTRAGRLLPEDMRAWNAGICCGLPQRSGVDDEDYIRRAVAVLAARYSILSNHVFAVGHSNGSMMALAMICRTDVFAAVVAISGPLALPLDRCPAARGKRVLALHGLQDENVPLAGGYGRRSIARVNFPAQSRSKDVFELSGAHYALEVLSDAGHRVSTIDDNIRRTQNIGLPEKIVKFFQIR